MMKGLYISIILLFFFQVKAQHNVIMEALDAPGEPQFTIVSAGAPGGWLGKGLPANTVDIAASQQISVNVASPGPYTFTSNEVNGVTFSASGTFTASGVQNVILVGSGTPVEYTVDNGTVAYTVTNTNGTNAGSANFTRKVYMPDQNYTGTIRNDGKHRFLYKVITGIGGKHWLQTNLGAHYNQVGHPSFNPEMAATNVDDYLAFGSLFQVGRNSDGHEIVNWTSATTANGLSTTATPVPANNTVANTGLFYTSSSTASNYGSAGSYLGRVVIGPGHPCPTGFTVANERADYGTANYNAGSATLFNNSIKLVAPKLYRNAENGALISYNRRLIRGNHPAPFPSNSNASPQFVIEGGAMLINAPGVSQDRRASETWVQTTPTTGTYDARGSLDAYPIRCVNPSSFTPGQPQFTIVSAGTPTGWLGKGLPANTVDIAASQPISVNVASPGPYIFTTEEVNGVTFSASGTFTAPGVQNVILVGSGTPVDYTVDTGTVAYTVTNTNGTNAGSANFTRKVYMPDQNYTGTIRNDGKHRFLYKVITGIGGKEWLQTNLGAHYNQVGHPSFNPEMAATNVDDYLAFGSLFQIGRSSDGHEIVNWTSATTANGLSATATPAPANTVVVNTGLFYTSSSGTEQPGNYYGYRMSYAGTLLVGPSQPCPTGFTVANEATDYSAANYNTGANALFNNAIKLVAPKIYRNATNGILTAYTRRLVRGNALSLFPVSSFISPQFVIEGAALDPYGNHRDRRVSETYSGTATSATYDVRGTLDAYPVRCVKF